MRRRGVRTGLALLAAAGLAPLAFAQAPAGLYSGPQAERGRALYAAHCAACHGQSLGGGEAAPPLVGAQFMETWSGQTLKALYDRIAGMPPTAPDALSRQDRTDVIAFLLRAGGYPSGAAELSSRSGDLEALTLEPPPS
jgi:mono/diheme cytochrome c family protein